MAKIKLRILGESFVEIDRHLLAPDAPRLFALMLSLCHAEDRALHKSELFELLFSRSDDNARTSHNLRQLVYRLRGMGVPIETTGALIRIRQGVVGSTLADFLVLSRRERLTIPASRLSILPFYQPQFSLQLADWVETLRSEATAQVTRVLLDDFRAYQHACNWHSVADSGQKLLSLSASSEEIVSGVSEALFLVGRKHDALDVIEAFLPDCDPLTAPLLRRRKERITKSLARGPVLQSTFYGRHDLMLALVQQWEAARANQPQLTVVLGPPGIGKSRLSREFGRYASLHGGHVLDYCCDASDNTRPHSLFRHLLSQLRSLRGSLGASPELLHHLDRLASNESPPTPMEPASLEAMRSDLQLALIDLAEAVAMESPLLLLVDDAQFLDAASRAVLQGLADHQRDAAVMILCSYRGADGDRHLITASHANVFLLGPLTKDESLDVLRDLLPLRRDDYAFLDACATRAGGNPYYLHAIARGGTEGSDETELPFDIRAFAASSYFGLDSNARTLFEACLLLGRFANLRRIREVTSVNGVPLLAALRALEAQGMISFLKGELRCTHALLEEASLTLIPHAVAAALHERIARCLEDEATARNFDTAITSAAADSWLAAGDVVACSRLLQHCAANAAALGEPRLAANTLLRIPLAELPLSERVSLLQTIVEYAEASGSRDALCSSLRDLLSASRDLPSSAAALSELEFRILEADLKRGDQPREAIAPLTELLRDDTAPLPIRVRAGIRLLIAADMNLDANLAECSLQLLRPVLHLLNVLDPLRLRAELIYETVFGDPNRAVGIASKLLRLHAMPSLMQAGVNARRNAAFALSRIGRRDLANPVLIADFRFMSAHHVTTEAAYNVLLLADNAVSEGDITGAARWLAEANTLVVDEPEGSSLNAGYFSAAAAIAMLGGQLEHAERLVDEAHRRFPAVALPRYRAFALAMRLRSRLSLGLGEQFETELRELKEFYAVGGHLGAQDSIVEALWASDRALGKVAEASSLLREYVSQRRRELAPPDASLLSTTASDIFWRSWAITQGVVT